MRNKMLSAAAALTLLASSSAFAAEGNWYVGGEIGQSNFSLKLPNGYSTDSDVSQDKSDTGYAAFVGYRFNDYVSGEIGYLDLGKYSVKNDYGDRASAEFKGVSANVVWRLPLNTQWTLIAKTGLLALDGTARAQVNGTGYSQSKSTVAPLLGVGVDYALDKHWTLRGQYLDVGASSVAEAVGTKVKLRDGFLSFGVLYGF